MEMLHNQSKLIPFIHNKIFIWIPQKESDGCLVIDHFSQPLPVLIQPSEEPTQRNHDGVNGGVDRQWWPRHDLQRIRSWSTPGSRPQT